MFEEAPNTSLKEAALSTRKTEMALRASSEGCIGPELKLVSTFTDSLAIENQDGIGGSTSVMLNSPSRSVEPSTVNASDAPMSPLKSYSTPLSMCSPSTSNMEM